MIRYNRDVSSPGTIRCKHCRYRLDGLTEYRCPECGEPFDPNDPETYFIKPPSVILPALLVQTAAALIVSLIVLLFVLPRSPAGTIQFGLVIVLALVSASFALPFHLVYGLYSIRCARRRQLDE